MSCLKQCACFLSCKYADPSVWFDLILKGRGLFKIKSAFIVNILSSLAASLQASCGSGQFSVPMVIFCIVHTLRRGEKYDPPQAIGPYVRCESNRMQ